MSYLSIISKNQFTQSPFVRMLSLARVTKFATGSPKILQRGISSSTIVKIGTVRSFHCSVSTCKDNQYDAFFSEILKKKSTISSTQTKPISNGFGEYVISKKSPKSASALSEEEFEHVYPILLRYSPVSFDATNVNKWSAQFSIRDTLITDEVRKINPDYNITFIPRTLYELVLIEECIQEDLKHERPCTFLSPMRQQVLHYPRTKNFLTDRDALATRKWQQELLIELKSKKNECWHHCYFHEAVTANIEQLPEVKRIAFRMNKLLVEKIGFSGAISHQKILDLTEKSIYFLRAHHDRDFLSTHEKCTNFLDQIQNNPGPTVNFHFENQLINPELHPMGLRHDGDAQILRNAIALECSELATRNLLLYRGGNFNKDRPFDVKNVTQPFSVSFGTSLFAGAIFDSGATVFHYIRQDDADGFVITIPFEELANSPFFIPMTHCIAQIYGAGEIFHARFKIWGDAIEKPSGVQTHHVEGQKSWTHLKSDQNRTHMIQEFQRYYRENVIFLK